MEIAEKTKNLREVEDIIAKAIKKVNGRKENDLCKYIPGSGGGYMHHFTLKKMKNRQPSELGTLLEKFIINTEKPSTLAPKQRAARGSRKKRDQYIFSKSQLEKMLTLARQSGDKEILTMLSPKKSLAASKRELIASIRHGRADEELWNSYVEALQLYGQEENTESHPSSFLTR